MWVVWATAALVVLSVTAGVAWSHGHHVGTQGAEWASADQVEAARDEVAQMDVRCDQRVTEAYLQGAADQQAIDRATTPGPSPN